MKQTIADYLPPRVRLFLYITIPLFVALEAIWDFLPNGYEDKITSSLTILGFGLAASQVPARDPQRPPANEGLIENALDRDHGLSLVETILIVVIVVLAIFGVIYLF